MILWYHIKNMKRSGALPWTTNISKPTLVLLHKHGHTFCCNFNDDYCITLFWWLLCGYIMNYKKNLIMSRLRIKKTGLGIKIKIKKNCWRMSNVYFGGGSLSSRKVQVQINSLKSFNPNTWTPTAPQQKLLKADEMMFSIEMLL